MPVVFRINKGGRILAGRMDAQSVWCVVGEYCRLIAKHNLALHDLRRTFGKLGHQGGALIEQIQLTYGHSDLRTTQGYLGTEQKLTDAPCDRLGVYPDLVISKCNEIFT
jgi:site-specific recombinase XerD